MHTNDVFRRLRYALDLRDAEMAAMINQDGEPVAVEDVTRMLLPDGSERMLACTPAVLERVLDGLIVARRGPRDPGAPVPPKLGAALTNNVVLQKLRIAMSFQQQDMLDTLAAGGLTVSAQELGALFRKPGHSNYRPCGDQLLRSFLAGLAVRHRA